jgi:hypothetical protein
MKDAASATETARILGHQYIVTGHYTEAEFFEDLLRVTEGRTNEELARFMVQVSREILPWKEFVRPKLRVPPSEGCQRTPCREIHRVAEGKRMIRSSGGECEKIGQFLARCA